MLSHLGPLEIECDAPSYPIVRACRKLGLSEPEDVRWCRKSRSPRRSRGWIGLLANPLWECLIGREDVETSACTCGHPLPSMEGYSFTFQTGEKIEYEMGQCLRCRTIYWEKR